tara:strand:+ start:209 stop:538 length:330 start_codon:yes stop_codon:yes gene_type:complete
MPQVEYTKAKGLVQKTGNGFSLNQIERCNGSHLTLTQGTAVCIVETDHKVTLPASPNSGDVILVISNVAGGDLESDGTQLDADLAFAAKGDGVICVYDGTEWQVLRSLT